VRAANPRVAVFSVWRDNPSGHPASPVVERYSMGGAHVFRTNGQSVWIEPYLGASAVLSAPVPHRWAETLTPPSAEPR
jgi:hypothetical protein